MSTGTLHIVARDRDEALVEALRRRESRAAERLVTTYQDRAYRLAIRIAGNAQDAEEIVQDAFLTVIRKIDAFRGESALGSWLYRIVTNNAFHKLRPSARPAYGDRPRRSAPSVRRGRAACGTCRRLV